MSRTLTDLVRGESLLLRNGGRPVAVTVRSVDRRGAFVTAEFVAEDGREFSRHGHAVAPLSHFVLPGVPA
jgi:hypothetical protein